MTRQTVKRGIRKYTAFVPKTVHATTNLGKKVIRGATTILNGAVRVVRQSAKAADKTAAKAIRTFTIRRGKKHKKQSHKYVKNHKRH
jgi:hypothetical protein